MNPILQDVDDYEHWLRQQCEVVETDLTVKHERMRRSAFDFLRASYFRWCRTVAQMFPFAMDTPKVWCVGDVHVENYGTWRDADARLVWGLNDFDEAAPMPYALDLIRLSTSACLVPGLQLSAAVICAAVLDGYAHGLSKPAPSLLDEQEPWLRSLVADHAQASGKFWREIGACADAAPPKAVRVALRKSMPAEATMERFAKRTKGGGSLGRPRYLAIGLWQGGRVVREAKAVVPSAWYWANEGLKLRQDGLALASGRYRSGDPSLVVKSQLVIRRVAPDATKIDVSDIGNEGVSQRLLSAMGAELAAVHATHRNRTKVLRDIKRRGASGEYASAWLLEAVQAAIQQVTADYEAYLSSKAVALPST